MRSANLSVSILCSENTICPSLRLNNRLTFPPFRLHRIALGMISPHRRLSCWLTTGGSYNLTVRWHENPTSTLPPWYKQKLSYRSGHCEILEFRYSPVEYPIWPRAINESIPTAVVTRSWSRFLNKERTKNNRTKWKPVNHVYEMKDISCRKSLG